jgi:hypothetical protein
LSGCLKWRKSATTAQISMAKEKCRYGDSYCPQEARQMLGRMELPNILSCVTWWT